jgi:hypothetical protein
VDFAIQLERRNAIRHQIDKLAWVRDEAMRDISLAAETHLAAFNYRDGDRETGWALYYIIQRGIDQEIEKLEKSLVEPVCEFN